jgi:putative pyruvate formate lyase activating enzyme
MPLDPRLAACDLCPRGCNVDRLAGKLGFCQTGAGFSVAAVCLHRGEEPAIGGPDGIANIFFTGCNLRCCFCQNHQISTAGLSYPGAITDLDRIVATVGAVLAAGVAAVGFVSPSHVAPQVRAIAAAIRQKGDAPTFVYNTNAYERPETLAGLESDIDVYLPDFKYADNRLAARFSAADDYRQTALAAIGEMLRQKGRRLLLDDAGRAYFGVIIRHLVLPGQVANSLAVLRTIAHEFGTEVHLSLMAQYFPAHRVHGHGELSRRLRADEYQQVMAEMEQLGFANGWVQEMASADVYRPDFDQTHPFAGTGSAGGLI